MTSKKELSERDICTKYITPALEKAGWNLRTQIREDAYLTDGLIYVEGNMTIRGQRIRPDYVLYYKPNMPIAVIEAKNNTHSASAGIQQSLEYARLLNVPFAYSSNGDGFREHDKTQSKGQIERDLALNEFPSPQMLWERYRKYNNIENKEQEDVVTQDYSFDDINKKPRYYQQVAINNTVEAIAKGKNRILLAMVTGTGKTYTAFQIIYRLWKSRNKKRILFLADRNVLIDQAKRGYLVHFGDKMTVVKPKNIDKSYEIYLSLYQGLTNYDEDKDAYREFSPNFFDLIVVNECHRGSADENSKWRKILKYFNNATHIGLTAIIPQETKDVSNIEYFGDPIYTYSFEQGIQDGFLVPYEVLGDVLNIDKGEINDSVPVPGEGGEEPPEQQPKIIGGGKIIDDTRDKIYVNGVNVAILNEIVQYLDDNGKLITTSFKDYTRNKVLERYESLDDFLTKWGKADKKQAIIEELSKQCVLFKNLKEFINKEMDIFDLICHAAFGQQPLTRTERANNVKKQDCFTKYGKQARKVLEVLLDKYVDEGIENIEDMQILKVNPLDKFGSPIEIVEFFGGVEQYLKAITELGQEIYRKVV